MTWKMFALPVVAAAVVAATFVLPGSDDQARAPKASVVTQSAYACPSRGDVSVATGRIKANPGAKSTAEVLPEKVAADDFAAVDSWNQGEVDGDALVVANEDARGAGAVGFYAGTGTTKEGGGLGVSACPGVTQDAWYLGAGSGGQHFSALTLTNLSDAPAVADISMWGDEGVVDAVDADGIVLDAFESRRIRLDDLAAGEPELAVRVTTRRGALSVAMNDTSTAVFRGSEPIRSAVKPARKVIVPGVVAGATGRQLLAFNPGDTTARVKIEALGKDGPFVPTGLEAKKIAAGEFVVLDLPGSVGADAAALRLTSDQPLTTSVRMSPTNKDFAYAVSDQRLAGPAVLPLTIGKQLDDLKLLLTAPGAASTVTVTAYDATMAAKGSVEVDVEPGSTTSYDLSKKGRFDEALDDLAYVVVTPKGTVHGAGVFTKGDGISTVPLVAAPLRTVAPDVRPGN